MARQSNDPRRGWYDEIMRSQYYDELIPAYEALQEQMAARSCSLFMICVRGISYLFTILLSLVWRAGRLPVLVSETSGSEEADMLSSPSQAAPTTM
jgi:hypothetical protein